MNPNLPKQTHRADICVVGGGMAGLIAAVAAARRGSQVVLIHDRPVLGGNASTEVRMWICGAHGPNRKETGLLEEIQLANLARNPSALYSVWDSVLFEYGLLTPGLTTLLNCSCNNASMEDGHITAVQAWQTTTQTWHTVEAKIFIDASGDSILAPLSGADTRRGREARDEFDEPIAPNRADHRTMGNTLLLQLEETTTPQEYRPPRWAYEFDKESNLPSRAGQGFGHNFWWIELGGIRDTIVDAEAIQQELMKTAWGVWDYMKNRGPQAEKLRNWRLRWVGSLPGKRENRRYRGPHILTQHDIEAEGKFEDLVAYGGWTMDDHHPGGLLYPGKATIFHPAPSPYGIPLRCLYSRNVPNLLCAGRNISTTHSALSSTRVMATTSIIGQAAGTAAALCIRESCLPASLSGKRLLTLQRQLMEDDCWLPWQTRELPDLMREATFDQAHHGKILLDGWERDWEKEEHAVRLQPGEFVAFGWESPRHVETLRLCFDSDLADNKRMPCRYKLDKKPLAPPSTLIRNYSVEIQTGVDTWEPLFREEDNHRRLRTIPVGREARAIRFTAKRSWGGEAMRLFSIEAHRHPLPPTEDPPKGKTWSSVIAGQSPEDLAPPDSGLEGKAPSTSRYGA